LADGIDNTKLTTPLGTAEAVMAQCAVPAHTGNSGKALVTDGSTSTWRPFVKSAAVGTALIWPVTMRLTAQAGIAL
jgi:hypothetical protein